MRLDLAIIDPVVSKIFCQEHLAIYKSPLKVNGSSIRSTLSRRSSRDGMAGIRHGRPRLNPIEIVKVSKKKEPDGTSDPESSAQKLCLSCLKGSGPARACRRDGAFKV